MVVLIGLILCILCQFVVSLPINNTETPSKCQNLCIQPSNVDGNTLDFNLNEIYNKSNDTIINFLTFDEICDT